MGEPQIALKPCPKIKNKDLFRRVEDWRGSEKC